jgi:hypothetical protein
MTGNFSTKYTNINPVSLCKIAKYSKNVLDVDSQTQGRLKFMIELYVSEKSVINSTYVPYKRA